MLVVFFCTQGNQLECIYSTFSIGRSSGKCIKLLCYDVICIQVNKKIRKFERKYRDCIKRNGDKIGTQTCYDISTYP